MATWQQASKPFKIASIKLGTSTSPMVMKWQTMTMMILAKTGKTCVEPRNMISKATSQWIAMWQQVTLKLEELCEAFWSTRSVQEEDENEQEMVPSFAETYEAL